MATQTHPPVQDWLGTAVGATNPPTNESVSRPVRGRDYFFSPKAQPNPDAQDDGANGTAIEKNSEPQVAAPLVFLPVPRPSEERFRLLKEWEGVVLRRNAEEFVGRICAIDNSSDQKEVVVPLENISESDLGLVEEGAVFYWKVGRLVRKGGQLVNQSFIKFRRLPVWQPDELKEAGQKANEFADLFSHKSD